MTRKMEVTHGCCADCGGAEIEWRPVDHYEVTSRPREDYILHGKFAVADEAAAVELARELVQTHDHDVWVDAWSDCRGLSLVYISRDGHEDWNDYGFDPPTSQPNRVG